METATKLSADEQKELAAAHACVREAESKAAERLAELSRVSARYSELVDQVNEWRANLDKRLSVLREGYLAGRASFDDLVDALRDLHTVELLEADLERQHNGLGVWETLGQAPASPCLRGEQRRLACPGDARSVDG